VCSHMLHRETKCIPYVKILQIHQDFVTLVSNVYVVVTVQTWCNVDMWPLYRNEKS
jgi:hypothetical protein